MMGLPPLTEGSRKCDASGLAEPPGEPSRMTEYEVSCECGKTIPVEAMQAGATITCPCGKPVQVPKLSKLRRAAGQTPIPLNVVEQIRSLIRDGQLPDNVSCPITGKPVDNTVWLHIQCERIDVRHGEPGFWSNIAYFFLIGWIWFIVALLIKEPRKEFGHDISVDAPLGINHAASGSITAASVRTLKAVLAHTPIYSQLLHEYPAADVWVVDDRPQRRGTLHDRTD